MMRQHLRRMARYNAWANRRLHAACGQLAEDDCHRPRPAFFSSIHGAPNQLLIGDRIRLARIEGRPGPNLRLDDRPYGSLAELQAARTAEDTHMIALVDGCAEADPQEPVRYRLITVPEAATTPLHVCWLNLSTHRTHHRGQVHDQLARTDVPPPPLDLIFYLREAGGPP
jgi:uncharacterized damage-inducible protein DinB